MATDSTRPSVRREPAAAQFGILPAGASDDSVPGANLPDSVLGGSRDGRVFREAGDYRLFASFGRDVSVGDGRGHCRPRPMLGILR
jgi:hypothetical protein